MYSLPVSIKVGDKEINIRNRGDYRVVLDCFNALQDTTIPEEDRIISSLFIFLDLDNFRDLFSIVDDTTIEEAIKQMFNFFNCGQENVGSSQKYKLIDWSTDDQLICSAINNVANTEIRSLEYCHWWTFMGYYISIGESVLSTVVGIRNKIAKGKKLEKYEQEFKKENPQYFNFDYRTSEQKEEEEKLRKMWGGKQ